MRISSAALFLVLFLSCSGDSFAYAPTCDENGGSPYCRYIGKVEMAYINDDGQILVYFDTPLDSNLPASVGISGVSRTNAAVFDFDSNPDFAKLLYASVLSAQARDVSINIQMREAYNGYLKIDRIWVNNY